MPTVLFTKILGHFRVSRSPLVLNHPYLLTSTAQQRTKMVGESWDVFHKASTIRINFWFCFFCAALHVSDHRVCTRSNIPRHWSHQSLRDFHNFSANMKHFEVNFVFQINQNFLKLQLFDNNNESLSNL